jgi:hypothetical protein
MYEIQQNRGENYKVNDEHILTLHMPDHKVIFWNNNGWSILWWDNNEKKIKTKHVSAVSTGIICEECDIDLHSNLKRHYRRKHPNVLLPTTKRKSPTNKPDMNNSIITQALTVIEEFSKTISDDNKIDISVKEYLKLSKSTQGRLAGVRGECVNWEYKKVDLEPYVLGLWLGDGMKHGFSYACDGENDYQIIQYLKEWGLKNDANIKKNRTQKYVYDIQSIENFGKQGSSPLRKLLRRYNLINNKHIPKDYLVNSREIRLRVLAGLIDTDGTVTRDGTRISICQSHIHERLVYEIVYLVRSLGFCCSLTSFIVAKYKCNNGERRESKAYRINISGNIQDIPTLLPRKKCYNTKKWRQFKN